jgi:hypothetical protein
MPVNPSTINNSGLENPAADGTMAELHSKGVLGWDTDASRSVTTSA